MKNTAKTAILGALAAVLMLSGPVMAGGPPPVCMVVDKIVMEPDANAPTRIQIWGTFIFCPNRSSFSKPVSGYLYYSAGEGQEEACRKEWAKLQKLAVEGHIVALGNCGEPKVDGHLRKASDKPVSPVSFPVGEGLGFSNGDGYERNFPSAKKLLAASELRKGKQ
jgi:hypothetical protein